MDKSEVSYSTASRRWPACLSAHSARCSRHKRSLSSWPVFRARLRLVDFAGLKDIKVETFTETTELQTGKDLWDWLVWSNPIVEMVLGSLNLTTDERGVTQQALEEMVRERAGGSGLLS